MRRITYSIMAFFAEVVVIDPWGSGGPEENTGSGSFLDYVNELKRQGLSEAVIAKGLSTPDHKVTIADLRAAKSIALNEKKQADIGMAQRLKDKGYSNVAIGKRMGIPESSVRSLLEPGRKERADVLKSTAEMLRSQVAEKEFIDIGAGVENHLGISNTKLSTAVSLLKEEGYKVHYVKVLQQGTGQYTTRTVLSKPDVPYSEIFKHPEKIRLINEHSEDGGETFLGIQPPIQISSKRVGVRYAEQGGTAADGVIFVRPGVEDLSLGKSRYAQVRIAVDGTHYLKGMAVYKNDLPNGVDLLFNTNKSDTGTKTDAMKKLGDDPNNPFGAVVRQLPKLDVHGAPIKGTVRSAMNIVNEEGNWETWSKNLSSQFLSKQSPSLVKDQLDKTYAQKKAELDDILKLTNPTVKRKLLESFAEDSDSSAVHLKAAILPGTANHVILPISKIKETEIYAPNYENGTRVALVRYPHGGTFEIPELVVNNKNAEARALIGTNTRDAVGIHAKVAERLSGADFDGDTVLVIPNNQGRVKSTPALEGLKNFDPKHSYAPYDGMRTIDGGTWNAAERKVEYKHGPATPGSKQKAMGDVSNLITDMTIKGADTGELARAVRHSMVVIDAEKHALNYRQSSKDNGIAALKTKYQGGPRKGASTIVSRKKTEDRVAERKQGYRIDPQTGRKIFTETGDSFVGRDGKLVIKTTKVNLLAETPDAHSLSSGLPVERIYADHSNRLKALANDARLSLINTPNLKYSDSAHKVYASEVATLKEQLNTALKNAPLERQAQTLAGTLVAATKAANPDMDKAQLKKVKGLALTEARNRIGAKKQRINISDKEWEAIQAGAISDSMLRQILKHADPDRVKELATPRESVKLDRAKLSRAQAMLDAGRTQAEVANALGVSLSTLKVSIGGE